MSNCFRWLHLTDLHWGSGAANYWNGVEDALFKDLNTLKGKCGHNDWDAVFFTGDLVNTGSKKEFEELDKQLIRIKNRLEKDFNSKPYFLCVPGNHDLSRPKSPEPSAYKCLYRDWNDDDNIKKDVLYDQKGEYWKKLTAAFKQYNLWENNKTHGFRLPDQYQKGLIPGDFSATIIKNNFKIGIIGLNTAFLHLSEGDFEKKLHLDSQQLSKLVTENHSDWFNGHHVNFLMTHHPKDWLSSEGLKEFGNIAPAGRFSIHLCGHQHVPLILNWNSGGGDNVYRLMQAGSLFSKVEYIDCWNSKKTNQRIHGYCAGEITFEKDGYALRLWPRSVLKDEHGNPLEFVKASIAGLCGKDDGSNSEKSLIKYQYKEKLTQIDPTVTQKTTNSGHEKEILTPDILSNFVKDYISPELIALLSLRQWAQTVPIIETARDFPLLLHFLCRFLHGQDIFKRKSV